MTQRKKATKILLNKDQAGNTAADASDTVVLFQFFPLPVKDKRKTFYT